MKNFVTQHVFKMAQPSFLSPLESLDPVPPKPEFNSRESINLSRRPISKHEKGKGEIKLGRRLEDLGDFDMERFESIRIDGDIFLVSSFSQVASHLNL